MAWNGSGQNNSQVVQNKPVTKSRRRFSIVLKTSILLVVIGIVVALLWLQSEEPIKPGKPSARPVVATNQTSVAKVDSPVSTNVTAKNELSPVWQKYYDGRDTNRWIVIKDPKTGKERLNRRVRPKRSDTHPPLYKSHALNIIDAIAFKPIISPMATVRIDKKFLQSFQEGAIEKIEIDEKDPEDVKARKEGMIQLRAELLQRMKAGESIEFIVGEALKDRNAIATYRHQMQIEYGRMIREGEDQEIVDAFGDKCNEILESKGATLLMTRKRLGDQSKSMNQ